MLPHIFTGPNGGAMENALEREVDALLPRLQQVSTGSTCIVKHALGWVPSAGKQVSASTSAPWVHFCEAMVMQLLLMWSLIPSLLQTRQFQTSYSQAYELTRGARKKLEQADELFQAAFGEASGSGFGAWARHKLHSVRPWLIRIGARFTHTLKPSGSGFS